MPLITKIVLTISFRDAERIQRTLRATQAKNVQGLEFCFGQLLLSYFIRPLDLEASGIIQAHWILKSRENLSSPALLSRILISLKDIKKANEIPPLTQGWTRGQGPWPPKRQCFL